LQVLAVISAGETVEKSFSFGEFALLAML